MGKDGYRNLLHRNRTEMRWYDQASRVVVHSKGSSSLMAGKGERSTLIILESLWTPHMIGRSAYMSNGATPGYLSAGVSDHESTGDACVVRSRCCWGAGVPTGPRFGRVV